MLVVDNKAGAAATIGSDIAAKSPGDGYTIVMGSTPTQATADARAVDAAGVHPLNERHALA